MAATETELVLVEAGLDAEDRGRSANMHQQLPKEEAAAAGRL